jgi:hypothetical protein
LKVSIFIGLLSASLEGLSDQVTLTRFAYDPLPFKDNGITSYHSDIEDHHDSEDVRELQDTSQIEVPDSYDDTWIDADSHHSSSSYTHAIINPVEDTKDSVQLHHISTEVENPLQLNDEEVKS